MDSTQNVNTTGVSSLKPSLLLLPPSKCGTNACTNSHHTHTHTHTHTLGNSFLSIIVALEYEISLILSKEYFNESKFK